ncbi:NAC domain-containing protein 35-like [Triticum dicoccoides]|uniref:NAC domain-containing protein 35-like n=1 Tax=Triticum dicoccoides TaxID=85692 RepID=UPI00189092BD|nr:NAC domain-containing protein 35-like [Triticum dicoccoides]
MSRDIDEGSVSAATAGGGGGEVGDEPVAGVSDEAAVDSHENDLVMPGFRFHPTEEELIEFYLRRKVEGRRFNVELITFLDLYRFDPWELPAMAVIGEKEWFFYVPRDRKYRNGDRPNRVTASGYWKATGADRMIRGENSRPIGLKKTLVFYSGKAPKGVRSSWIMNEYRLPPPTTDADLFYKSEISLCRVYKRSGIDDGHGRPSSSNAQAASARPGTSRTIIPPAGQQVSSPSSTPLSPTQQPSFHGILGQGECSSAPLPAIMDQATPHNNAPQLHQPRPPPPPRASAFASAMSSTMSVAPGARGCTYSLMALADAPMMGSSSTPGDELSRLVGHSQAYPNHPAVGSHFLPSPSSSQIPPLGEMPVSPADKLWDWIHPDTSGSRDYGSSSFK